VNVAFESVQLALSEWGTELLDLTAYLHRIGNAGPVDNSSRTLHRLHRAHVAAISFENLDAVLGHGIKLDLTTLQDKLVRRSRGGYCHEHSLLFGAVLDQLGFPVMRLLARVCQANRPALPRGHAMLLVEADAQTWLADVGYGGDGPLEPIPLVAGITVRQGRWTYRLETDSRHWTLQVARAGRWVDLYSFSPMDFHHADFEMASYFVSTHPSSPFANDVIVHRTSGTVRYGLRGRVLTVDHPDNVTHRLSLGDGRLVRVLEHTFGIKLTEDEFNQLVALI
jgi:N-hydroxyarylamine O-acetyltransferase